MAYKIDQVLVDVHQKTATVVFRDPPKANVDGSSIKVSFYFEQVQSEGGKSERVVSEALQVLRDALVEITAQKTS